MSFFSRLRTGLALPAVTVAFTPARVLSSHFRRRYYEKYRERYRFPAVLFVIDVGILAVIPVIFVAGVWLARFQPQPEPGLKLELFAPPIVSATNVAMEAKVTAVDQRLHRDVRLRWVLPAGAQVVSASPAVDIRQEVRLGDVGPRGEARARLVVRFIVPPGAVRLGFYVQSEDEALSGLEVRPVVGSAVHLEEQPQRQGFRGVVRAVENERVLVLRNSGSVDLNCVRVSLGSETVVNLMGQSFKPHEQRVLVARTDLGVPISVWCGGVELERQTIASEPSSGVTEGMYLDTPPSIPGQTTVMTVTSTEAMQLLVYHPLLREADQGFRIFDVPSGVTSIPLPLEDTFGVLSEADSSWLAWPLRRVSDGYEAMGRVQRAHITTPFVWHAAARYYAASGGQIGVGPWPLRVGERTRLWVEWSLESVTNDLSQIEMRTRLPEGVAWTGAQALPDGGTLAQEGRELWWRLPFLAASSQAARAAFEVALIPTKAMRGSFPKLLENGQAQALENRSGVRLQATSEAVDTSLPQDEKARGRGMVR